MKQAYQSGRGSVTMRAVAEIVETKKGRHQIVVTEIPYGVNKATLVEKIAELHKVRGITIILVSHSMEDVAKYVERLIVVNHGKIAFDDIPKKVFAHYKELEEMGLAAPQITYIMHALKEKGLPVDPADTTVEEAKQDILHALREMNSSLLKGGVQND